MERKSFAPFAVIFDMDGLMMDTERMARAAWTRALADHGYNIDSADYLRIVGRTVQDAQHILSQLFGPELPFEQVFAKRQAYYDEDIEQNGIPTKAGLFELLDFLERKTLPKAVASSTPCWFATRKLERIGVEQRFLAVVCGDMVAQGKPAPDLFLEAARRMAIPPERCIVLEDSEAGIRAAHNARMLPLMIPDLKQPEAEIQQQAYRILPSLLDVIPLLEEFLRGGLPALS
jgi:beta-phosphoglucomutase-like phosphatase (HAD superfamily)